MVPDINEFFFIVSRENGLTAAVKLGCDNRVENGKLIWSIAHTHIHSEMISHYGVERRWKENTEQEIEFWNKYNSK